VPNLFHAQPAGLRLPAAIARSFLLKLLKVTFYEYYVPGTAACRKLISDDASHI
jgi:hypothetical protein